MQLIDGFQRRIDYVRLSLTDQCNFQCFYCRPQKMEKTFIPDYRYLNCQDIDRLFYVLGRLGVTKVKLTGGEPLLRRDIGDVIGVLSSNSFLSDISLTTNGFFLEKQAANLKNRGLSRLNVSLDSLKEDVFHHITQTPMFSRVWRGILKALDVGFSVKLNVVLMKGMNDNEIFDFVELATRFPLIIRFIEFMPTQRTHIEQKQYFFSNEEAISRIRERFLMIPELPKRSFGPSRYYRIGGSQGTVGFISPLSHHFCDTCNRIRISAKGALRLCLFSKYEEALFPIIRSDNWEEKLRERLAKSIQIKPLRHDLNNHDVGNVESFVSIGG